ncbi:MAG: hypothetical protein ACFB5Z_12550 [Elainellaceae cyanobacterium]
MTRQSGLRLGKALPARLWLAATLAVVLVYSLPMVRQAFSTADVVQDDARQHVFWMQRFLDPSLFPQDLIADYFQAVGPPGYTGLYWLAAQVGIPPMLFHKLLPSPLLLLTAALCFALTLRLSSSPVAAAIAALLLAQGLGLTDAIVSATPKAFIYPLLMGLLYALAAGWRWGTAITIALQGLFYPQLALIAVVLLLLRLVDWRRWRPAPRSHYWTALWGIAAAALVLLPYALQSHGYGPTLTLAEARSLPELSLPGSRARFFVDDPAAYWLEGRSGLRLATVFTPVTNGLGLLLPLLLWRSHRLLPQENHLPQAPPRRQAPPLLQKTQSLMLLPQMAIASLIMFGVAHLLLFRLHLPSRYTQHSLRVVLSVAAAIAIVTLIDGLWRWARAAWQRAVALAITTLLGAAVLLYPLSTGGLVTAYQVGQSPALYDFLRQQPAETTVASLSDEANNLPSFTGRSILVGGEYAIPYHTGYYQQIRDRAQDLIRAQYSSDLAAVQQFIRTYRVTHWLFDRNAFGPRYRQNNLLVQQFSVADQAEASAGTPVLQQLIRREICVAFRSQQHVVLDADCLQKRDRV